MYFDNMDATVISPKNTVFQLRMNKEVKEAAEDLFGRCGLTLADALNLFIQQSLNRGGIPFEITGGSFYVERELARERLLSELNHAADPASRSTYTTEELRKRYGV